MKSEGRVLVTYGGFRLDHDECGGALERAGLTVESSPLEGGRSPEQMIRLVGDAVAVIADADPFDAEVLAHTPNLRIIARTGVGLDSIDLEEAGQRGIHVTTTPGTNDETVADHALALILAALRRIVESDARVRSGDWRDFGQPLGQISGSVAGVVGAGAIGTATASRLEACGAEVIVHDPFASGLPWPQVGLDELLTRSDIVSLHAPLTPSTRHLLDRSRIGLLKPSAVVVNTSRGPLIDEVALAEALTEGCVRAAGLDVFETEPPAAGPIGGVPNLVRSPHQGGISDQSNLAMSRAATESVLAALAGTEVPRAVVGPFRERS